MQDISLQEEMLEMALALYADKDTLQKLLAAGTIRLFEMQTTIRHIKCVLQKPPL